MCVKFQLSSSNSVRDMNPFSTSGMIRTSCVVRDLTTLSWTVPRSQVRHAEVVWQPAWSVTIARHWLGLWAWLGACYLIEKKYCTAPQ